MTTKRARLKLEIHNGNIMLSKLYDMETNIAIPFQEIRIDVGIHNWKDGVWATVKIPIEEVDITDMPSEIVTEKK